MSIGIAATIGMIATMVAIVLLYVKVLPKKYDGKLDKIHITCCNSCRVHGK
ncbi:Uncharacterised protein [uncultured Blautia sp.]|nr:Uncharacterised protein [uncultured Blautia sp.]